jgi:hypothetical protein
MLHGKLFDQVQSYCMFVGHPRSGHTLIGALLDAHPHIVIAHELNALRYVRLRFSRRQLFSLLLERSEAFGTEGRMWTGFSYKVRGAWQGRFERLLVIGDKKGGESSRWLLEDRELLGRLRETVRVPVKLIHITRNPFDNIATMSTRTGAPVEYSIDRYFRLCEGIEGTRGLIEPSDFLTMMYEEMVADPTGSLKRLCEFLAVAPVADYLEACSSVVFDSPHKSRHKVEWTREHIRLVEERMRSHCSLREYRFDD